MSEVQDKSTVELKVQELREQETPIIESKAKELSEQELANLKVDVVKQFEFYFSKYNLPRDKYLKNAITNDPDFKVDVDKILSFKKVKKYQPYKDLVLEALKESKTLEVKDEKIGPVTKFDLEVDLDEIIDRSIYLRGFDKSEYSQLAEELHEFMAEKIKEVGSDNEDALPEEQIARVDLRTYFNKKTNTRGFKGSVYIEFIGKKYADKFYEYYKQRDLKFKNIKLQILTRKQHETKSKVADTYSGFESWTIDGLNRKNMFQITGVTGHLDFDPAIKLFYETISGINYIVFGKNISDDNSPKKIYIILHEDRDTEVAMQNFNSVKRKLGYKLKSTDEEDVEATLKAEPLSEVELSSTYALQDDLLKMKIVCNGKELHSPNKDFNGKGPKGLKRGNGIKFSKSKAFRKA
ncbi:hypothetical protein K502DRAFT_361987 [Neoconidiobolus thromboides FSU 785]|nr:hypothetical protein K502DRAFT_361987 [Neoconidiobolus thromboides FSU 785]